MKKDIKQKGFTLVELLTVIAVIAILSAIVITYISNSKEKAYRTRADVELQSISNALKLYANEYNAYPPDKNRDVPAAIKKFINVDDGVDEWPKAPWPTSMYDYEAWDVDDDGVDETYQISIRFCDEGQAASTCIFPNEPWAVGFKTNSAYYHCVKGYCRSHENSEPTYPGYCVNCPDNKAIRMPSE